MKKRLLVLADSHCGHHLGLTPPAYLPMVSHKMRHISEKIWGFFDRVVEKLCPIHVLLCNGDLIEGDNCGSGGLELAVPDRNIQCEMAIEAIKRIVKRSPGIQLVFTVGTAYHTGMREDLEETIARNFKAPCDSQQAFSINKTIFHARHKIGGARAANGRFTPIASDRLWNVLFSEKGDVPKAHVIIRSHVHSYSLAEGSNWTGFTTPGLKWWSDRYGARIVPGTVDVGLVHVDVGEEPGDVTVKKHLLEGERRMEIHRF